MGGFKSQSILNSILYKAILNGTPVSDRIDPDDKIGGLRFQPRSKTPAKIDGYYSQAWPIGYGNHITNRMKQTLTLMHYIDSLDENDRKDVLENLRFRKSGEFLPMSEKVQFASG